MPIRLSMVFRALLLRRIKSPSIRVNTPSPFTFFIPRRNWTTGTTYDIYRHDYEEYVTGSTSTKVTANSTATTLFDATFYVLTSDRNVYKCLDNDGNTASTVEPTGTSTDRKSVV